MKMAVRQCLGLMYVATAMAGCVRQNPWPKGVLPFGLMKNVEIATGTMFAGTEIGGLSAVTWDQSRGVYYVLADDPAARFYTVEIDMLGLSVKVVNVTTLLDKDGQPFKADPLMFDPEGMVYDEATGHLILTSEGNTPTKVQPFIRRYRLDGTYVSDFTIPSKFLIADGSGVRRNAAFESATLTPDGKYFFTAGESALIQDGTEATLTEGTRCRIVRYDTATGVPDKEFMYVADKVVDTPVPADAFKVSGIVGLLALDHETLLVIERSFSVGVGNVVRIFKAYLGRAADVSGVEALDGVNVDQVVKEMILDVGVAYGITNLDNLEGITLGPRLPNGARSAVIVSDNNFLASQVTQFLLLEVKPELGL